MTVIYTCPQCGGDLHEVCLPVNPPKYKVQCFACGWSDNTKEEKVIRIPYEDRFILNGDN